MLRMRDHGVDEYASLRDMDGTDVGVLHEDDRACLDELGQYLVATDAWQRFGVRLIRNPLGLSEHELLHETCDSVRRTLQCDVGERDALLADRTVVQTAWQWKVVHGEGKPTVMQDCSATCQTVGEGHDVAHTTVDNPDQGPNA